MKQILILLSFLMAVHLVACCSYGLVQLSAEELVEKNSGQEILEKELPSEYALSINLFQFRSTNSDTNAPIPEGLECEHFSSFITEVQPPPPDLLGYFYQA